MFGRRTLSFSSTRYHIHWHRTLTHCWHRQQRVWKVWRCAARVSLRGWPAASPCSLRRAELKSRFVYDGYTISWRPGELPSYEQQISFFTNCLIASNWNSSCGSWPEFLQRKRSHLTSTDFNGSGCLFTLLRSHVYKTFAWKGWLGHGPLCSRNFPVWQFLVPLEACSKLKLIRLSRSLVQW
jgi:hypothetical protein